MYYSSLYYRDSFCDYYSSEIANTIKSKTELGDLIIIESSTASLCTWCELIASKLRCKHICFDFEEVFPLSESQIDFAYFKHLRHELAGIVPESVPLMFRNSKYKIDKPEYYSAMPELAIQDVPNKFNYELSKYDVVIGSFGRLEKEIVWPSLLGMKEYIELHPEKKVAVVLIGDTRNSEYKNRINGLFTGIADLFITGEVWPVPLSLVKRINVFISSAGSAVGTAIFDIPTIVMSPEKMGPLGILNYTTYDVVLPSKDYECCLLDLLKDILDFDFCNNHESLHMYDNYFSEKKSNDYKEFARQERIALEKRPIEYFDVFKLKTFGGRFIASLFGKIFGHYLLYHTLVYIENKMFRLTNYIKSVNYSKNNGK